ncbi:MAG: hypothetical protein H0W06_06745 [Chloroflexia bacterium]|nr:hypothetical protein [Chloroflexia bacterium]
MSDQIEVEVFRAALVEVLDETFDRVEQSLFLDPGTSFFETLATVSAAEASRPVSARCASIAGQVNHVVSFIDWLNRSITGEPVEPLDWAATWRRVDVSEDEWRELVAELRRVSGELRAFAAGNARWEPPFVTGAFGIVAHCAYHLGEVRQALCTIKG